MSQELIINKTSPCNCGCHGQDPWHKATYRRNVALLTPRIGFVRLPMSSSLVRVTRHCYENGVYGPWTVDRDSIVLNK